MVDVHRPFSVCRRTIPLLLGGEGRDEGELLLRFKFLAVPIRVHPWLNILEFGSIQH